MEHYSARKTKELEHNHMKEPLNNYVEWKKTKNKHKGGAYTLLVYSYKILGKANKSIVTGSVISWRAEWGRTEGLLWGTTHTKSDGFAH